MKLFDRIFGRKSSQKDLSKEIIDNANTDLKEEDSDVVGYKYMDSCAYKMINLFNKNSEKNGSYSHCVDFFKRSIRCVENIIGSDDKLVSKNLDKSLSLMDAIKMFEDSLYKLKIDDSIIYGKGLDQPIISDISEDYSDIPTNVFGGYFMYVNTIRLDRKYVDNISGRSSGLYCLILRILAIPTKDIDNFIFCNKSQFNRMRELSTPEDLFHLDEVLKENYPMTRLESLGNEEIVDHSYFGDWM
jgi:hypothetical protein